LIVPLIKTRSIVQGKERRKKKKKGTSSAYSGTARKGRRGFHPVTDIEMAAAAGPKKETLDETCTKPSRLAANLKCTMNRAELYQPADALPFTYPAPANRPVFILLK
jgi:hypothetical protein